MEGILPNVRLVDDEKLQRELAFHFLSRVPDIKALFAESGQEALHQIANEMPDLVLTDLAESQVDTVQQVLLVARAQGADLSMYPKQRNKP